eukprot:Gb_15160 [translate_table: standard]
MFAAESELLMSQAQLREKSLAKWRTTRLVLVTSTVVIFSIPVALLPYTIRRVQPTAEFVFLVVAPGLWNSLSSWISPPCLYVVLNIVLVTLGVKSGALSSSNEAEICSTLLKGSDQNAETKVPNDFNVAETEWKQLEPADEIQKPSEVDSLDVLKPKSKPKPRQKVALYSNKSRSSSLRRSTTKLSNLSRKSLHSMVEPTTIAESSPTEKSGECLSVSAHPMVIFEICTEQGSEKQLVDAVVDDQKDREEESLSSDELYAKAESFIGNFYRELQMQREDSWKRLHGIYRQSC